MNTIFLFGGGWQAEGFKATYSQFLASATRENRQKILLILADNPEIDSGKQRFEDLFRSFGLAEHELIIRVVSKEKPLTKATVFQNQPTGIFIAGGLTPAYQEALCLDKSWLDEVIALNIPYAGFSAGAAIAAEQAIVGGWKLKLSGQVFPILDAELAEELEFLDVRQGLGIIPFSVDIHASQWGTITRLIHAVDQKVVMEGWAIDEDTMLKVTGNQVQVFGLGQAYFVQRITSSRLNIQVFRGGDVYQMSSQ